MTEPPLRVAVIDPDPSRRDVLSAMIDAGPERRACAYADFDAATTTEAETYDVAVAAAEADPPPSGWAAAPILALLPVGAEAPDWADAAETRPVRPAALLAAIRSLAARALAARAATLPGGLSLDPSGKQLSDGAGGGARLTEKEAATLIYLAGAAKPAGRDELLAKVWGYAPDADSHTVETHIHRLRRKLEGLATPLRLVTDPGGYRLRDGDESEETVSP